MNDKFLYENRPPVRKSFGNSLYARISSGTEQKRISLNWRVKFAFAWVALFAILFATSAPVRANMLEWIRNIAGLGIQEVDSLPVAEKEVSIPLDASGPLAHILKSLPYEMKMPAYVPGGFVFQDYVDVQDQSVFMHWINASQDEILMLVDTDHGQLYQTGTDAAQEIQINGQPAVLVQGGYDNNHNWDSARKMTNLIQRKDHLIYWLTYIKNSEGPYDRAAARDELVHMMSSLSELKIVDDGVSSNSTQPVETPTVVPASALP